MFVTWEVLKFWKSNEINEEHPENIENIPWTLVVIKLDKFSDEIDEQSANIVPMLIIWEVSNWEKSKLLISEHPLNMHLVVFILLYQINLIVLLVSSNT